MNKLFEVYSKGLFRSLNRAVVPEVIELFKTIPNQTQEA